MTLNRPLVTRRETPNVSSRQGHAIDQIVLHVTEGSAASVRSWFGSAKSKVSAGYMVTEAGPIDQFADDAKAAWHAGIVDRPTAPLVVARPGVNPNLYSIGIEHEGSGKQPMTPTQLQASLALTYWLCQTYHIPMDRRHIVGHHEIRASKSCPGAIDVDAYVRALVAQYATPTGPVVPVPPIYAPVVTPSGTPVEPLIVWSDYFKDRLIVTTVRSDSDWEFVTWKDMLAATRLVRQRAETPLSKMPATLR